MYTNKAIIRTLFTISLFLSTFIGLDAGIGSYWDEKVAPLKERGIQPHLNYSGEIVSNLDGGSKRGTVYQGLLDIGIEADLDKLVGWKSARASISIFNTHGASPSSKYVGDTLTISNLDAPDSIILSELWIEQAAWDGQVALRVGQLLADSTFFVSDYGTLFLHDTFAWSQAAIQGGTAYVDARLGVLLTINASKRWALFGGVYDNDLGDATTNINSRHATQWSTPEGDNSTWLVQANYDAMDKEVFWKGLWRLGFWKDTADVPNNAGTRNYEENKGGFLVGERPLWEDGFIGKGKIHGRFAFSPSDRNRFDQYFETGLTIEGPLSSRPDDALGFGYAKGMLSSSFTAANPTSVEETVFEITYRASIHDGTAGVQPSLQYIKNPGGPDSARVPDALAFTMRFDIAFE